MAYESPTISDLGSVDDFTRGDNFAWQFDNMFDSRGDSILGEGRGNS